MTDFFLLFLRFVKELLERKVSSLVLCIHFCIRNTLCEYMELSIPLRKPAALVTNQ